MIMKKLSILILIAVLVSILSAGSVLAEDDLIKIGILQLVEHPALDAAYQGFVDALTEAGYTDGVNIEIDYQNAQADQSNLMTISERFVKNKVDLILAIATPAAQAVASATTDIPILFTAVTDPVTARLVESNEVPGLNVTGTTDAGPIDKQIALLLEMFPEFKKLGIIYNSSEINSEVQAKQAEELAAELGISVEFGTITSVNDIEQVAISMITQSRLPCLILSKLPKRRNCQLSAASRAWLKAAHSQQSGSIITSSVSRPEKWRNGF
jgi:putative ABC transport system substrate-binding protein